MTTEETHLLINVFEHTLDLVCIVDKKGWFRMVNPAVIDTLGYTKEELMAHPVSTLIHPEDKQLTQLQRNRLLNDEPLINFQNRYITKDGNIVWLQWTSVYMPEKEVVFAIAKNITAKRLAEMETEENIKKYRELATHFKQLLESDRQYFATELHEELGQLATVVKMDLEWIASLPLPLDETSQKRLAHGLAAVQSMIDKIRKLSRAINPIQIDDLGLNTVLQILCDEFMTVTNIQCLYEGLFNDAQLSRELKLDLFRICQEALTTIGQQAQATMVRIQLKQQKNRTDLSIWDNGKRYKWESEQALCLKTMHGRAASLNGKFAIQNEINEGTTIRVSIESDPLD